MDTTSSMRGQLPSRLNIIRLIITIGIFLTMVVMTLLLCKKSNP